MPGSTPLVFGLAFTRAFFATFSSFSNRAAVAAAIELPPPELAPGPAAPSSSAESKLSRLGATGRFVFFFGDFGELTASCAGGATDAGDGAAAGPGAGTGSCMRAEVGADTTAGAHGFVGAAGVAIPRPAPAACAPRSSLRRGQDTSRARPRAPPVPTRAPVSGVGSASYRMDTVRCGPPSTLRRICAAYLCCQMNIIKSS